MFGTPITIVGNIVDEVVKRSTDNSVPRVSFRVVSTQRRRDKVTGEWTDGQKLFIGVTFWRDLAENVAASMSKGDPVVVHGRIYSRQYIKDETSRVSYEVEAESIGHDLSRGVSRFERRRRGMSTVVEVDEQGLPAMPASTDYLLDPDVVPTFGFGGAVEAGSPDGVDAGSTSSDDPATADPATVGSPAGAADKPGRTRTRQLAATG